MIKLLVKLKSILKEIINNAYLELIILYTILVISILAPIVLLIISPFAYLIRMLTGSLLDPFTSIARRLLSSDGVIIFVLIFLLIFIALIINRRVREGRLLDSILIYDVVVNYDKDFKTLANVIVPMAFLLVYMVFGSAYYSRRLLLIISIIIFTMISYAREINKVMSSIKTLGSNRVDISKDAQYEFTKTALKMLEETNENITIAIDEQLKSERLKTELITNISHDLKTPLTSIINYTDLLKNLELEDEQFTVYVNVLDRNTQRLKLLITDLVYASKAETGNVDLELNSLELNELVSQVYGEFEYVFRKGHIGFVFDPNEDIYIMADSNHLGRVLINIMDNAIKYAQEGTRIYANTVNEGDFTSFSLKNISKEELNISPDDLMEQFVRGERSRHTEGSGLGLYISRSLMELMGGKLILRIDGDLFEVKLLIPSANIEK